MYFDTVTATYNLKTGKRLTDLSELFPNGVEFVNAVNSELLSDIDTFSGNHYGSIYKFKDGFMALTEAEAKNFTYNSIIFTAGSQVTELGYEASFYADSLATEYCDMSQFFTENFTGYIRDAKKAILLDGEKVISIGGSENAGVYIPSDADAALIKAAEHLAEYMGQFVSEEIALKIYHDAGYTNVVKVEYNFPKFLVSKLGNMFYQFSQFEEEYDNIYYAYDADGNRVFDVNLMVDPWLIDEAKETYYYFQDTGENVNPSLKEGWEKVSSFVSSDGSGKEWTYDDVAEKLKNITIEDVNFLTGKCYVYLYGDEYKYGRHQITVTIPRDYIILR